MKILETATNFKDAFLKMRTLHCFEMLGTNYAVTWHHILEQKRQCVYNVTLRYIHKPTAAMEEQ